MQTLRPEGDLDPIIGFEFWGYGVRQMMHARTATPKQNGEDGSIVRLLCGASTTGNGEIVAPC